MHPVEPVEFSRPFAVDRIPVNPVPFEIEANAAERTALATRFGLLRLDHLRAKFTLRRLRKDQIRVKGRIEASLVQACVVTLDPVPADIAESFELDFIEASTGRAGDGIGEIDLEFDAPDGPEPLTGPEIDLGEVTSEQLGLAIDPYPRKADAAFPSEWGAAAATEPAPVEKVNPFAALEKFKKSKGDE